MKCDQYIGFDLHPATTVVAVLDADGKVAMETIVATEAAAIIRLLKSLRNAAYNVGGNDTGAMDVGRRARLCEGSQRLRSPRKQTAG
jgi:hypothetical protein